MSDTDLDHIAPETVEDSIAAATDEAQGIVDEAPVEVTPVVEEVAAVEEAPVAEKSVSGTRVRSLTNKGGSTYKPK